MSALNGPFLLNENYFFSAGTFDHQMVYQVHEVFISSIVSYVLLNHGWE